MYLARRTDGAGWSREVAIKLLDPARADDASLRRFRDEARILGLVRDRAVVASEPPVRLQPGWAVVMEYVPGLSLQELLDAGRPPPRAAALELVAEIARALANLGSARTAEGQLLGLIHRDLKPANLQLTRAGEVKILDFGIARANLPDREASTTRAVVGSPGYLAPERLLGQDTPAGDIYALGVILGRLTGSFEAVPEDTMAGLTDATSAPLAPVAVQTDAVADLARRMTSYAPTERPTAREVERAASALRQAATGPGMREWCERAVPEHRALVDDALCGQVLEPAGDAEAAAPKRGFGLVLAGLVGGFVLIAVALWSQLAPPAQVDAPIAEVAAPAATQAAVEAPVPPASAPHTPEASARPTPEATRPAEKAVDTPVAPKPIVSRTPPVSPAPAPVQEQPTPVVATPAPPTEPPRATSARVAVRGDAARVVLISGARRVTLPGEVPAGTWKAEVSFPGREPFVQPRALTVEADRPATVSCALRLNGCTIGP